MLNAALMSLALLAQEQVPLLAAPRDSAPQQAVLWAGENLEVRGERGEFLQVYDHRRERAGYVRATSVRQLSLAPESAPELLAVVRFLRDAPGMESLGIGYAAAYLKAAPAEAIDGEIFSTLGTMADRLAQRGSSNAQGKAAQVIAAQLEVAASYGVTMTSLEREGQVRLCYEGEAHRRVLALPATDAQKAQAVLALTRHDCISPDLTPVDRFNHDNWRAGLLDGVPLQGLPEVQKNRLRMRQAGVLASLAWQRARRPEGAQGAREAAERALEALAAVNKGELMESDAGSYNDAAIRVGASRWAAEPAATAPVGAGGLSVRVTPGQPGESCVHLVDAKHDAEHALFTRCTYGMVWPASATAHPQGTALTLAVQPLDSWRELWVFRRGADGWGLEVVPPGVDQPGLGYLEFAGWVPGETHLLTAREIRAEGRYRQSFELMNLASLEVEKQADKPANLSAFYRHQSPGWKGRTVAVR